MALGMLSMGFAMLATPVAAQTSHTWLTTTDWASGNIANAVDTTSPDGGLGRHYVVARPGEIAQGPIGLGDFGSWEIIATTMPNAAMVDSSGFPTPTVGGELLALITERDPDAAPVAQFGQIYTDGASVPNGYTTCTPSKGMVWLTDPDNFLDSTLTKIPTPTFTDGVSVDWTAMAGIPNLYGYGVLEAAANTGPWTEVGQSTGTSLAYPPVDNMWYSIVVYWSGTGTGFTNMESVRGLVYGAPDQKLGAVNNLPAVTNQVTVPNPHNGNTASELVTITADIDDAVDAGDTLTAEYRVDGGAWVACAGSAVAPATLGISEVYNFPDAFAEGAHTVEIRGFDGIGYSPIVNADFTVTDITAPLGAWGAVPADGAFYTNDLVFTASYEDFTAMDFVNSYFAYSVNGTEVGNSTWDNDTFVFGSYTNGISFTIAGGTLGYDDTVTWEGRIYDTAGTPLFTDFTSGGPITLADPPSFLPPFPVYGYVYLYDGAGGVYNPLVAAINVPVQIEYVNFNTGLPEILNDVTDATGQYSIDTMFAEAGQIYGIEVRAGPFTDGVTAFGNMGYNWTAIPATAATDGGIWTDVICGIPYEIDITAPLDNDPATATVPFPVTYTVLDIDGVPAQGYFSYADGDLTWTSGDVFATLPVPLNVDGTTGGFTGVVADSITLVSGGPQWINISEGVADWHPSVFDGFTIQRGGIVENGWFDDYDNITLLVAAGGYDWQLVQGWNLVSCPQDGTFREGGSVNAFFDAQDALEWVNDYLLANFGEGPDLLLSLSDRTGVGTYQSYGIGEPEPAWGLDTTSGYWVYYSLPTTRTIRFAAVNATCSAANTVDVALDNGWNLLGLQHNYSVVAWGAGLSAAEFTDGTIATVLDHIELTGARTKIVMTEWLTATQWYNSYVVDTGFPGMTSKDWPWNMYSFNPGNGYWLWVDVGGLTMTYSTIIA